MIGSQIFFVAKYFEKFDVFSQKDRAQFVLYYVQFLTWKKGNVFIHFFSLFPQIPFFIKFLLLLK